jgi:hypothetical protein
VRTLPVAVKANRGRCPYLNIVQRSQIGLQLEETALLVLDYAPASRPKLTKVHGDWWRYMTCRTTFDVVKDVVIGVMIESIHGTDCLFAWKLDHPNGIG